MATTPIIPLPARAQDLSGRQFGRLIAIAYAGKKGQQSLWKCECLCGATHITFATNLLRGKTSSCGCGKLVPTEHAQSISLFKSEYHSYRAMLGRCLNKSYKGFARYGGRGISVCDRWRNGEDGKSGFTCFLEDMGAKPRKGLTIERKDTDLGYLPRNCVWATMREQQNNRSSNVLLMAHGETRTIAEWARIQDLLAATIRQRLKRGKTSEEAIMRLR